MKLINMQSYHCSQVAKLHLKHLQTVFCGKPGFKLLQSYYLAIIFSKGASGFVVESNNDVIGYICGVWDPSDVHATLLKRGLPALCFWGVLQMLIHPQMIADFLGRLFGATDSFNSESGYELRPIVVTPKSRGSGTATLLLNTLLEDAENRGFSHVHLFTEENNLASRRFYSKSGFNLIDQFDYHGLVYFKYEYIFFNPL